MESIGVHKEAVYAAIILATFLILVLILKVYNKATCGKCHSYRSLKEKVVLITGANRGIGKEVALDLAMRGAKVIIACRDKAKGQLAAEDIIKRTGNKKVVVRTVDIASLFSVRSLASDINNKESRLDILIHNAGVMGIRPRQLTTDDIEITFATNALGPFLLTRLLLDLLKKSAPASIIFVSSVVHHFGKIQLKNLNGEKHFNHLQSYNNTKLAQILYVKEFAKRLVGSNVTVNAVHPGLVNTDLFQHLFLPFRALVYLFIWIFCKTPKEGSHPIIHLAVAKEVENLSGKYFADCKVAKESTKACDMAVARELWDASEKMASIGA